MRKPPAERLQKIDLSSIEGLDGCTLTILANPPLRAFTVLNDNEPRTLLDFLGNIVRDWSGFDMELNRDSMEKVTLEEWNAMFPLIRDAITNPQKPTKNASP